MIRFNPLPAMKPGGTLARAGSIARNGWFQSAPGDEAGRNGLLLGLDLGVILVSIRSRR